MAIQTANAARHCYGLVLHHRLHWWLVEFPELDVIPVAARKLSGRLTPALADWLRREPAEAALANEVASLNPESRCWSGEFSYVPSDADPALCDIDAHPWGAEAGELEARFARALIEMTLHPIPSGFVSVLTASPPENQPVLAIRLSGYICATFEVMTARHMPTHRPRSPWRDLSGDAVSDSGSDILGWRGAADWLTPA